MTAFANHFAFEFKTGLRNSSLLLMNYLFPLAFYAMMGLVMTKINPTFNQLLIPAMVVMVTMTSTILGLPGPLVEMREAGVFRSFKINSVPALSILAIPTLTTIFHALIASAFIAFTAGPFFKGETPANWLAFAGITLLTVLSYGAMGTLIGVIATNSRSTVLLSQLIFLPSMLLGGMMIPLNLLPESVRPVAMLIPTSHVMQAFSGLAYGKETILNPVSSLIILAASGLLAFGLAAYLFNWDSRNNTRRGNPILALLVLVPYVVSLFLK